jgi:predicted SAM-dependent methyltransferase
LPFVAGSFDRAVMADIVEHLYPEELSKALSEAHRVLASDGQLIVHTMPNIWYYRVGYPVYRLFEFLRGKRLPKDPRQRWRYADVHVNEQSIRTLKRALRAAGFRAHVWVKDYRTYSSAPGLVRAMMLTVTRAPLLRFIFCDDIFAVASKEEKV